MAKSVKSFVLAACIVAALAAHAQTKRRPRPDQATDPLCGSLRASRHAMALGVSAAISEYLLKTMRVNFYLYR